MGRYKVIELINANELLINYGFADGAKKGDRLRIIETGEPVIYDGKDYGTYDAIKADVVVHTAYEHFSLCKGTIELSFSPLTELLAASIGTGKSSPDYLNADKTQFSNRKLPEITPIKVGDPVIVLPENSR